MDDDLLNPKAWDGSRKIKARLRWACMICGNEIRKGEHHRIRGGYRAHSGCVLGLQASDAIVAET